MMSQAVVSTGLQRMTCAKCGRAFTVQPNNVTFCRDEQRTRAWFEVRCLHCGAAHQMSCDEAKQSVDAEILKRAFQRYEKENQWKP